MSGIYVHIPFCKKRCTYCDFHFSTSFESYRDAMILSICKEIQLRKEEHGGESVKTIYLGGGTPSLLTSDELKSILSVIHANFNVDPKAEITLECNPDDVSAEKCSLWLQNSINRLSIGLQSFREFDLKWMNRAHNATESLESVQIAKSSGFSNISVDLMYGLPTMTLAEWNEQILQVLKLGIQHISAYCLTIEQKTALKKMVEKGELIAADEDVQSEQFTHLIETLRSADFEQYEISNFSQPDFESKHNSSYWKGEKYFGFGPSAHSFDGFVRRWNLANNQIYISKLKEGKDFYESEILSPKDRFNEYIMTGLRTKYGVDLNQLEDLLPLAQEFNLTLKNFISKGLITQENKQLFLTETGKLQADHIASSLFIVD